MYKISLVKLNKFFNSYFLRLITCKNKSVKMYKILKKFVKLFYFILYDSWIRKVKIFSDIFSPHPWSQMFILVLEKLEKTKSKAGKFSIHI